jgi:aspartyl-tRNA(Asn)/glutamyl-tRNA(Gln) amidotransferase subunit B
VSTRDQAFSKGTDTVLSVIGLEIHVQLSTESKLFCGCANRFGDPPNTLICPVCLGLPGALPVLNEKAIDLSIKVGLALNCRVADRSIWDRKSYYYPDLPKNYQISQYDHPLCTEGYLEIPGDTRSGESAVKKIRIRRAHLEEDAGKNVHDNPSHTGVDLNRAGVPLLEIVSEPDLNSPDEVLLYARAVQRLVRWLGAGSADMEKGQMRFEPNVNLHITRKKPPWPMRSNASTTNGRWIPALIPRIDWGNRIVDTTTTADSRYFSGRRRRLTIIGIFRIPIWCR